MKEETAMREINFYPETDLERSGIVNGLTNAIAEVLTDSVRGPYLSVKQGKPDRYKHDWSTRMNLMLDAVGVTMMVDTSFDRIEMALNEFVNLKHNMNAVISADSTSDAERSILKAVEASARSVAYGSRIFRAENEKAEQVAKKVKRVPCPECGGTGLWKDDNSQDCGFCFGKADVASDDERLNHYKPIDSTMCDAMFYLDEEAKLKTGPLSDHK